MVGKISKEDAYKLMEEYCLDVSFSKRNVSWRPPCSQGNLYGNPLVWVFAEEGQDMVDVIYNVVEEIKEYQCG